MRARLGESEVAGLLAARVDAMPPASRPLVEAMACLGGRAELSLLQAATGAPAAVVDQPLAPALDEGLLVIEPGAQRGGAVPPRPHPRGRSWAGWTRARRRALQLAMARRLAAVPELFAVGGGAVPAGGRRGRDPVERRAGGGAAAPRGRPGQR